MKLEKAVEPRRPRSTRRLHNKAFEAILEVFHVEIHQKPDRKARQLQVGEQLCIMDGQEFLDTLEFENQSIFHENIYPVSTVDEHALVFYGQWPLNLKIQVRLG